jgi:molybdopterin/thiamine biosynthesis adenylyltransferase
MNTAFDYESFTSRNRGYVDAHTQQRISTLRILVAGCGIGSSLAICAARIGFQHFTLVDGDRVDLHNLNRQFYDVRDVGLPKVQALRDKLLAINPNSVVEAVPANVDASNVDELVAYADVVFDTIDFLDLGAILTLHRSARSHRVPIFTALSAGFGALVWYFPADSTHSLADVVAPGGADAGASYADVFSAFVGRIAPHLDAEVVEQVESVLAKMREGQPCPASQVAVGSFTVAAMAASMMHSLAAGLPIPASPKLVVHSFKAGRTTVIDLATDHA